MRVSRVGKALVVATALAVVAACGGDGGGAADGGTAGGGPSINGEGLVSGGQTGESGFATGTDLPLPLAAAEITWMHNGTAEPQRSYWAQVATQFEALHPGVTVTVVPVDSDELRTAIGPDALLAGDAPDLFQSWGGGQLTEWVNEGLTRDLGEVLAPTISGLNQAAITNWQLNDQTYGLPYAVGPAGFWVNLNLMKEAGLADSSGTVTWPTDLDGLFAMWATLKDHGITPVAVGGGSGWAAPFWYYALVAQLCSAETINAASTLRDFSDSCWEQAGTELKAVVNQDAFNEDWGNTPAQGGADSSAGQVALGRAAMELSGPWGGAVISSIYQGQAGSTGAADFIAWYPFPAVAAGGGGSIAAGGDGFSVLDPSLGSEARSDAAAALLAFILSDEVQAQGLNFDYRGNDVAALPGIPTNSAVAAQAENPILAKQTASLAAADHQVPWLDVHFGSTIGSAMTSAVNSLMRGQISAAALVTAIKDAAGI